MHTAVRSSRMTVALLTAGVIAVTPVAPPSPEIRIADAEVRLAASSILNVPANLLIDLVNIPYNESQAVNYAARSLLFTGTWFVVSPTNLWGVDPGDPGHFMSVVNLAVPFPALSGMGLDQSDQNGLGQQLWHLAAAELPVNTLCDADSCLPTAPTSPITGISGVDALLWPLAIVTGLVKFPIIDSWLKVPLPQLMSGYTFGPDYPGYADPRGPAYPGFGFPGTTVDPVTGENLMPFANTTFTLDLAKPFTNYLTHLMADPSTNPIRLPNLVDIGRSLQALLAGLVMASDPITPGSPFCPGACSFLPAALDYAGIVKTIAAIWPGNPLLEGPDGWLTAYANARANGPTQEQIEHSVQILQPDRWDFGNPSPPPEWSKGLNLSKLAPFFHKLWTALGLNPPPLAVPAPATDPAPSIAALRQAPLPSDVQLDAVPEGSEGQKSGGADVLTDKAAQPSEHSASTTTSTDATVDATEPKMDSPSKTTSTDATVDATEPKVDSPSKTASTNATDDAKKPKATDEGKKFQPRHVRGKDAARSAKSGEAVNGPHTGDGSGTVDHAADAAAPAQ